MAYFSNSTEADVLEDQCAKCILGSEDRQCPVALIQLLYNYDQVGNQKLREAMEILVDTDGICKVREEVEDATHDVQMKQHGNKVPFRLWWE